jgi:hypothetical protein
MTKEEIIVKLITFVGWVIVVTALYRWDQRRQEKALKKIDDDCEKAAAMVKASQEGMPIDERLRMHHEGTYKKAFDKAYQEVSNG